MNTTNGGAGPIEAADEELIDTLIAISVVALRLARRLEQEANLRQTEGEKEDEEDE